VFVDGCFWHGCPRCYRAPSSRAEYWRLKIAGNKKRDRRVARQLRAKGWSVIRIRECSLRKNPEAVIRRVHRSLDRSRQKL
jgi:DNA mismatch endonuclease (patch repair protein)